MALMRDDPLLYSLLSFPDEFATLFDSPVGRYVKETQAVASTAVDVKESPTAYSFVADLPGLKREEVKVQVVDGNVLSISGERTREEKESNAKYHRVERSTGKFVRRFRLPQDSDLGKITAAAEHGVLTVTVPKVPPPEPEKPKVVDIAIS
eukprot:TRINITY_DN1342_c0_g1_i5.p1 TRINITY_DN1342_c0_g1~~TRINITY_DN1342_c0_g1_i5.p1  ORF type:complete len:151 (+),score=38.20 TRINITY_DN1342_c0_g1_i5:206-658(+)